MKTTRMVDGNGCLSCTRCKATKSANQFSRSKHTPSGYSHQCRDCRREISKESYQRHKDAILAKRETYRDENRDRIRVDGQAYYRRNKEYFAGKYNPKIGRAGKAVQTAVRCGKLPPVDAMYCVRCFARAENYHHQSYLESDRLCVVPVCRGCHHGMNRRRRTGNADLGVIATHYGIVRIAIATIK